MKRAVVLRPVAKDAYQRHLEAHMGFTEIYDATADTSSAEPKKGGRIAGAGTTCLPSWRSRGCE